MSGAKKKWIRLLLLLTVTITKVSTHCEQKWDDIKAPHMVAESYHIHLLKINTTEEYRSFMPNTKYQILVRSDEDDVKFTRFYLTVENENKSFPYGMLELYDDEITQFSQDCPDSIIQTSQVLKDEVSTYWISPEEGAGCVIFRASIMESPSRWFMDGSLEQKFCQDPKATIDDPGPVLPECCACDEAKYELAFEGLWSRYTHPKNFPTKPWSARFSDVIGASHTSEYRFWEYGGRASEGLQHVAESGVTRVLESELKNQSQHIRTIIKARGINFPNITSKTFAMFRVDQQHHLVSLVSMIDPSPDWFVGVSGLELCLANCSWAEHKELNLYPVDAGTDDGVTYESVNAKTEPQDVIRRITTSWPADERSPFYDETAIDMNPLARLYLKRQRVYEKNCDSFSTEMSLEEACRVTHWGEWESCSATCGRGVKVRVRQYKNEKAAKKHKCETPLTSTVACFNRDPCPAGEIDEKRCPMTEWSEWTPCTKPCGPENRIRSRTFKGKRRRKECRLLYPNTRFEQTLDCGNPSCEDSDGSDAGGGNTVSETSEASAAAEETSPGGESEDEAGGGGGAGAENTEANSAAAAAAAADLVGAENRLEVTGNSKKRRRKKCVNDRYTPWSFWSPCSVTCGMGTRSRSRQIKPDLAENTPDIDKDLSLYECQYESVSCLAETKSCEITKELMEVICSQPEKAGRCPDGHDDSSLRYYYNRFSGKCDIFHYTGCSGNMNNFRTQQECLETCGNFLDYVHMRNYKLKLSSIISYRAPDKKIKIKRTKCDEEEEEEGAKENSERKRKRKKHRGETKSNYLDDDRIDCKMSEWSDWSPCYSCKGYRTMSRDILIHPRNGGRLCPSKIIRRQKCHKILPECGGNGGGDSHKSGRSKDRKEDSSSEEEVTVHCRVSEWSAWTPCTCGTPQRRRSRKIVVHNRGARARPCPPLIEAEECILSACS